LRTLAGSTSKESCRKHAAVVEHEDISGAKMCREISELIICESASRPIQHKHARSRPVCKRLLRNQLFWKMKIEVGDEHVSLILLARKKAVSPWKRKNAESSKAHFGFASSLLRDFVSPW